MTAIKPSAAAEEVAQAVHYALEWAYVRGDDAGKLSRALLVMQEALRGHAIKSTFQPHDGPDNEVNGYMCWQCDRWWKKGHKEYHAPNCLAALAAEEGQRA